jgi:hypothetical protein
MTEADLDAFAAAFHEYAISKPEYPRGSSEGGYLARSISEPLKRCAACAAGSAGSMIPMVCRTPTRLPNGIR